MRELETRSDMSRCALPPSRRGVGRYIDRRRLGLCCLGLPQIGFPAFCVRLASGVKGWSCSTRFRRAAPSRQIGGLFRVLEGCQVVADSSNQPRVRGTGSQVPEMLRWLMAVVNGVSLLRLIVENGEIKSAIGTITDLIARLL